MKTIYIIRDVVGRKACLGNLYIKDENNIPVFGCNTVERGWNNNQKSISCIPVGKYPIVLEYSPRFDTMLWEIKEVPGRSECKIHSANFAKDLNGCIAPGYYRKDMDKDGIVDVGKSRDALKDFHSSMGEDKEAIIVIINEPDRN